MSAVLDKLAPQFTALIGPEAFAKHAAAVATAQAAAAAHAAAIAQAAAAAKAAAPVVGVAERVSVSPSAAKTGESLTASATAAKPAAPATPRPTVSAAPAAPAAPRPSAPPAPPPPPPAPLAKKDHAAVGYDLDATVAPQQVVEAARILDAQGFALDAITGVDWLAQNQMEVVYDYYHPTESARIVVRTRLPRAEPNVPTITPVFPGANWHERETHDFFGITFTGHPNLKPFLLPEDANFHPLRKDYAP